MSNNVHSVVNYTQLLLTPDLVSKSESPDSLLDSVLQIYQGKSVILSLNYPIIFLLKILFHLRFTCFEVVLATSKGELFSLFREHLTPIIESKIINTELLDLNFKKSLKTSDNQVIFCDSHSDSLESSILQIENLQHSDSIYLIGEKNKFLILVLSYFAYFYCKKLFYQKDLNSKLFRIF